MKSTFRGNPAWIAMRGSLTRFASVGKSMLNALTVDVEEHFQVHAFETVIVREKWESFPSRVVANTRRVLRLFAEQNTQATFFILGWVADRHPKLVKDIAAAGHEVATHGYWHDLIYRQTPEEFAADLTRSLEAISKAFRSSNANSQPQVIGYRAPTFSITRQSLWALDILKEHNIRYDSSTFPLAIHDRYGINNADRFAHRIRDGIWEFPVSTVRLLGCNWPVAGGGYFRLLPYWVTRLAIHHINAEGQPAVVYLHPWEFDPEQPLVQNAPLISRFRHYVNLNKTEHRVRKLLQEFKFAPIQEVFVEQLENA